MNKGLRLVGSSEKEIPYLNINHPYMIPIMYDSPHTYLFGESNFWIPRKFKVRVEVSGAYPASQSALQIFHPAWKLENI